MPGERGSLAPMPSVPEHGTFRDGHRLTSPFVGRIPELAMLIDCEARCRSGVPVVALVEADGGMGKSTLLNHFAAHALGGIVLRASANEEETGLPYGVISQLVTSAAAGGSAGVAPTWRPPKSDADPLAVGADLLCVLGELQREDRPVAVLIDDFHWVDLQSARALLFALRRLSADRVLSVLSTRPHHLARLGDGWRRFIAGDHRVVHLGLPGLSPEEISDLARTCGVGELPRRAATRLAGHTGGNPLYCATLLRELGTQVLDDRGQIRRIPKSLSDVIVLRLGALGSAARRLVAAAAVLGQRCALTTAAELADLTDPFFALEQAVGAGLLAEEGDVSTSLVFSHALVRQAVYEELSPTARRRLHERAAQISGTEQGLLHRVAAAAGPDDDLAVDLETTARRALRHHRGAQAASWLSQASALSPDPLQRDRRLLDAVDILIAAGDVAGAEELLDRLTALAPSPRRQAVLGTLDLFAGRGGAAEDRLVQAWETHDPRSEPLVGAAAAGELLQWCFVAGRMGEAVTWGRRAAAAASADQALRRRMLAGLSRALFLDGWVEEAFAVLDGLCLSATDATADLDALVVGSFTRVWAGDLERAAKDLAACAAQLRAGTPLRYPSQCLTCLADAEYRLGRWDTAAVHANLSVALAHDAGRVWDFAFVHSSAALVPACRGEWEVAAHHVEEAQGASDALGAVAACAAAATARARLAATQGDFEGVVRATEWLRSSHRASLYGRPGWFDWRPMEVEALLALGDLRRARASLQELEATLPSARPMAGAVDAARLRGDLAMATGDVQGAKDAFGAARVAAGPLRQPLPIALAELSEARHHRRLGDRAQAVACVRGARERLVALGARPYVQRCDAELAACGVPVRSEAQRRILGLTAAEQGVARLVGMGHTNRQISEELYVSMKTVEFHLRNIFTKLDVRSRRQLAQRLAVPGDEPGGAGGDGEHARR